MNEKEKELVAALRSGEYVQGKGYLRNNGYFCCLGVACDLYDPSHWSSIPLGRRMDFGYPAQTYWFNKTEVQFLPSEVRSSLDWLTFDGQCRFRQRDGGVVLLTSLNDQGFTFDQIADIIEAGLVYKKGEEIDL